ncbi:hypothetical protein Fmac_011189 [Flemingia macrophylla]|uniref:Photosystem I chlorophyll a apoprotein A1 n=1 Tax=Flemingia macrophylla TaxID=520843 RepID=A0ABD1MLQ8_9FABA
MIIRSPEPEVKILVDRDPIKTSFEEWAKPGHFSRTIAKGPDTTTWIWNLHADAHDFDSHTSDLEEISRKVFSAHFGQLSIIFLCLNAFCWLVPLSQSYSKIGLVPRCGIYVESPFDRDLLAQIYPSFAEGATPFLTLNWSKYAEFLTFRGGLDPVTGGLWLTDIVHHHLAIAILFLIAGHMYRTNWDIGHSIKEILEAHKGPFTGQGHKGRLIQNPNYEIPYLPLHTLERTVLIEREALSHLLRLRKGKPRICGTKEYPEPTPSCSDLSEDVHKFHWGKRLHRLLMTLYSRFPFGCSMSELASMQMYFRDFLSKDDSPLWSIILEASPGLSGLFWEKNVILKASSGLANHPGDFSCFHWGYSRVSSSSCELASGQAGILWG